MPEIVFHHFFARKVFDQLPERVTPAIRPEIYFTGARGPDPLGIVRFWQLPVWKREHRKSFIMHHQRSGIFFRELAAATRSGDRQIRDDLFSYLCGFLTHYYLDANCHPYIIYRTGLGAGTAGNHRSMEHAMDRDLLREHQLSLHERPISRSILASTGLPAGMKTAIDRVYYSTFGWENTWKLINNALKDERRFVRLMEDPRGRLDKAIPKWMHNGTLRSLSYAEQAYQQADYWNNSHTLWKNPYDPSICSNRSLKELETEALSKATEVIPRLMDHIYGQGSYPEEIGSLSYESGLPTDDARNQRNPQYDLYPR